MPRLIRPGADLYRRGAEDDPAGAYADYAKAQKHKKAAQMQQHREHSKATRQAQAPGVKQGAGLHDDFFSTMLGFKLTELVEGVEALRNILKTKHEAAAADRFLHPPGGKMYTGPQHPSLDHSDLIAPHEIAELTGGACGTMFFGEDQYLESGDCAAAILYALLEGNALYGPDECSNFGDFLQAFVDCAASEQGPQITSNCGTSQKELEVFYGPSTRKFVESDLQQAMDNHVYDYPGMHWDWDAYVWVTFAFREAGVQFENTATGGHRDVLIGYSGPKAWAWCRLVEWLMDWPRIVGKLSWNALAPPNPYTLKIAYWRWLGTLNSALCNCPEKEEEEPPEPSACNRTAVYNAFYAVKQEYDQASPKTLEHRGQTILAMLDILRDGCNGTIMNVLSSSTVPNALVENDPFNWEQPAYITAPVVIPKDLYTVGRIRVLGLNKEGILQNACGGNNSADNMQNVGYAEILLIFDTQQQAKSVASDFASLVNGFNGAMNGTPMQGMDKWYKCYDGYTDW